MPRATSYWHAAMIVTFSITVSACAARADRSDVLRPSPFPGALRPTPEVTTATAPTVISTPRLPRVDEVVATALAQRGVAYRPGGDSPASGFDCSGFVRYVLGQHAVDVPRTAGEQYRAGVTVARSAVLPGDLVFFSTIAPGASHVGLVVGPDEFVHAPASNGVVRVESLSSSYWRQRFVGARRILSE